jgi:Hypoxia induced protein conserved region
MDAMKTLLIILVVIAMLATLGVMFAGMLGLVRSDGNGERSNALMRWRVVLQGVTLALFVLLLLVMRH